MIEPAAPPASGTARRWVTSGLLLAGLVGVALAARSALRGTEDIEIPGPIPLVACFVTTRTALWCGARCWADVLGPIEDRHRAAGALYQSQLVKYLPAGGFLQAAGQVGMTIGLGVPARRVALALAAMAMATVTAGLALGSGLVLVDSLDPLVRTAALLGLAAPLLMRRDVLAALLGLARRAISRIPEPEHLPEQRALWRAVGWCGSSLALYSTGFTILLRAMDPSVPVGHATVGYDLSWVAGFVVLPLPSGVGVREAVLVWLVPSVTAGPLLAASLAQRLMTIASELTAVGTNRLLGLRRSARRSA